MLVRGARALGLWGLLVVVGCGPKAVSPATSGTQPAGAALGTAAAAGAPAKTGPVEVMYFGPQGETEGRVEISVSFDRPMVALGTRTEVAEGVLTLEPPAAGKARWVGSQTLLFEPSAALPMASAFTVRVAKGVRALDGQELAAELTFGFTTPALALVSERAPPASADYTNRRWIDVYFNQPVASAALRAHAELSQVTAKKPHGAALDFSVEQPDPHDPRRLRVVSKTPFALASRVTLRVSAGLLGLEGPRPLPADVEQHYRIYGPLQIVQPAPCRGDTCVSKLVFSNPVKTREAFSKLRFEPPLRAPLVRTDDYETQELYFGAELEPDTTYRVSIEGELKDVYGTRLEGERVVRVQTPPYSPLLRLLLDGELIHESVPAKLRTQLQNVKNASLDLYPLTFAEVLPGLVDTQRPRAPALAFPLGSASGSERKLVESDPSAALKSGKGVLLACLTGHQKGQELRERRLIAYTDLAPSLKVSSSGGVVWLTRFSDASPVAAASVHIVVAGQTLAKGQTDAQGLFAFRLPPRVASGPGADYDDRDVAAVVQLGDDISFARKFAGVGPWELTERASYGGAGSTSAHLFTERGIYRPGDTLQLKGILRSHDKNALVPTQGELIVRAVDASNREIESVKLALSPFGTFAHGVRIPGSVELGPITLSVKSGDQEFALSAEVAEYRPAELELSLRVDRELSVRGESVSARIAGHYLFGAPARDASMYWSARYLPRSFTPERYPGFSFEDEDDASWRDHPYNVAASGEGKLDAAGELNIAASLAGAPLSGPSSLEIETSVVSHGSQVASSTRLDVVPASVLVGVRPASALGEVQKPLAVELVALTPHAEPVADVVLEVSFKRRSFTSKLVDGQVAYEAHEERVGSCRPKSQLELVRCSFTPSAPGLHIARVRAKDRQGRVSTAARYVYVSGAGEASWGGDPASYLLALESNKTRFALGETAKLLVPSPWQDAEALITVEREGVLSVERTRVGRASTVDVRIDERFVPNAFVSVLLVRPLDGAQFGAETGPPYRLGTLELAADVSTRKLLVEVTPDASEKRPGDELTVQLAVRDGRGKATSAELTVFAVDEGVLSLTGYQTPDPFAAIYAPRALAVWTSDARGSLARALDSADEEKGGDEGGGGGELARSNFAAVALYVPSLLTDADGKASLRFKLPDGTTRYRIMAVAASRGAEVGSGQAAVRTKKPLLLRPLAPRVLRAGDRVEVGVLVHNERELAIDAEVELSARGLALQEGAKKRIHVPAASALEVRWLLHADQVGEAQLRFSAEAAGERDAVAITRRVLSPSVLETVSAAGVTQQQAKEALAPLASVRPDVGGLELALSTSALVELEAPARALLGYEYGCTEQLSSRLIALAALERLRVPLALSDASFGAQAAALASELERHQRADGGFGLWSANDASSPALSTFLTSYALIAFSELRAAGLPVSSHAEQRALAFLASALRAPRPATEDKTASTLRLTQQAFTLYALAASGHPDPAYEGKLFEQRSALPVSAQVELLHALAKDPQSSARVDTLLQELGSHVRVSADEAHLETNVGDAYAPLFISDVRATSALVLALLAHKPEHALLPKLARWLSATRGRDGSWRGTHESAWGLRALAAYLKQQEAARPDLRATVTLGARELGRTVLIGSRAKASLSVPMRELPTTGAPLTFDKQGSGALHYVMRLGYAASALPTLPSERGFFVERSYERIDPAELASGNTQGEPADSAAVGDYVRVTLRVAVPSARRFVLISDPLPAGLEPVDLSLATEASGAAGRALDHVERYDHRELRDDRAVFAVDDLPPGLYRYTYLARASTVGSFVAPPTKVEEMYHPETQGLTAANTFVVRAP